MTINQYALVTGGVVQNIIDAAADFIPIIAADYDEIIQMDLTDSTKYAGPGDTWDSGTQTFTPRVLDEVYVIGSTEFKGRFTAAERTAMTALSKTDVSVESFMNDLRDFSTIDLSDTNTIDMVNHLEANGVILASRIADILAPNLV